MLSNVVAILTPYVLGSFLDVLVLGANRAVIINFCIVFGGLSLVKIANGYIALILHVKIQTYMSYNLNKDIVKHIQELSLSFINQRDSVYLNKRVNNDASGLIIFCISVLQNLVANTLSILVPFVVLLTINRTVTITMVAFIATYILLYYIFRRAIYRVGLIFREAQDKFFAKLFEQLKYVRFIKINSMQEKMFKRADDSFIFFRNSMIKNQKVNYLYSGMDGFISIIAQIVLFVMGGIQVLEGNFTIGMFTIFAGYFNIMLGASRYFFGLGAYLQNTLTSYNRIVEILNNKPESTGNKVISNVQTIEVRNLGFSYSAINDTFEAEQHKAKKVINNLNIKFQKGIMYVVSGVNGAGKSTLLNILLGMYVHEYTGFVSYDGVDIRNINMKKARETLFGLAEQEPTLINANIGYNLGITDTEHTGDYNLNTLNKYIEILNIQNLISLQTLNYEINDGNTNASGGERQKISILRVLYKNPVVMILDEPTSALDSKSALGLMRYLSSIKKNKLIIIVSHDDIVRNHCDEMIVL